MFRLCPHPDVASVLLLMSFLPREPVGQCFNRRSIKPLGKARHIAASIRNLLDELFFGHFGTDFLQPRAVFPFQIYPMARHAAALVHCFSLNRAAYCC